MSEVKRLKLTRTTGFVVGGLLVALLLAGFASYYASRSPDGLNRVATDQGIHNSQQHSPKADGPLAGYNTKGVDNHRLSKGLAGVAGVGMTFLIGAAVVLLVRRRGTDS
ncbi:MAG: PDGLE domain-containing protein [Mycobacteriales bacterium]